MKVNFNQPIIFDETLEFINQAILGHHLSGMGPFTKKCEELLNKKNQKCNLLVTSATHALEMMGLLLEISHNDEVILPSFTFVSTANAFALRGAKIRFADNDEFGNIKPSEVARLISKKTKAIVAVHYAGNSANMDELLEISHQAKVPLLEDAAQAIGSTFRGKSLGTIGSLGCYSFHETKNISSGEGGALICGDPRFVERAEVMREKGTNRRKFVQGLADKYTWVDIGSSYVLSDLNSAYLYPQLLKLDLVNSRRKEIWKKYRTELQNPIESIDGRILEVPAHNENPNAHMFALIMPNLQARTSFIDFMRGQGIVCPFHYVSLHTSPYGKKVANGEIETLPNCEKLSSCLVRLPLFYNLTVAEQDYVVSSALKWLAIYKKSF